MTIVDFVIIHLLKQIEQQKDRNLHELLMIERGQKALAEDKKCVEDWKKRIDQTRPLLLVTKKTRDKESDRYNQGDRKS